MKNYVRNYFVNLLIPSFVFGSATGIVTAVIICFYKLCATYVIGLSELGYRTLRGAPLWLLCVLPALCLVAWCFSRIYARHPNLSGGGIPTAVGALRGILHMQGWKNLLGVFTLSLPSFLIGVPLGNEGPSVQMGTAIGKGCVRSITKKHRAWERYSMTGGACAGFSVATGAPISGILFSVEEAHQRISPMLLTVSATSVMFAELTAELLSRFLPIHTTLFPKMNPLTLSLGDVWLPLIVGIVVGLFAVLFLRYYRIIRKLVKRLVKKISKVGVVFFVFALTVLLGLCSDAFVSTGHELMLSLFEENEAVLFLLLVLAIRATMMLFANTAGVTGGLFVPILALGALVSAILGRVMVTVFGLGQEYLTVILILGIVACVSAMMKMPLTAIVFAVEALSCYTNILYVIVVAVVSYVITEFFGAKSINDSVIEHRAENLHGDVQAKMAEAFVTVRRNSFAEGKQIRDILWPSNTFVLSIKYASCDHVEVDGHGGKAIRADDVLHVRYSTYDSTQTLQEILAIVGEQEVTEIAVDKA